MKVSQLISMFSSASCSAMARPLEWPAMKTRMLRDWKPWMSFTASSFFWVAPAMATKPGMRPSTSLMPC